MAQVHTAQTNKMENKNERDKLQMLIHGELESLHEKKVKVQIKYGRATLVKETLNEQQTYMKNKILHIIDNKRNLQEKFKQRYQKMKKKIRTKIKMAKENYYEIKWEEIQ